MKQFLFKLCLQGVGGERSAHPDFLLEVLNRRQLAEWVALANLFPFGDERLAIELSHQTFHLRRGMFESMTGEGPEEQPSDFMPKFEGESVKSEVDLLVDEIKGLL